MILKTQQRLEKQVLLKQVNNELKTRNEEKTVQMLKQFVEYDYFGVNCFWKTFNKFKNKGIKDLGPSSIKMESGRTTTNEEQFKTTLEKYNSM